MSNVTESLRHFVTHEPNFNGLLDLALVGAGIGYFAEKKGHPILGAAVKGIGYIAAGAAIVQAFGDKECHPDFYPPGPDGAW